MTEKVRLVIWDLDDTFWRGTLSEGGIREYIETHHQIVVELARRGIISSICSKNDRERALDELRKRALLDYFVFPSISWDPKGPRIARLIERVGLRAASVMFIDDNPFNLAEAAAFAPGLQTESEAFLTEILEDPRFFGKSDPALTRLKQYKLLELRAEDEAKEERGNEAFLWSCGIRVFIDTDVEANLDRAVELINRTNQLNFTKRRLPEDDSEARARLLRDLGRFDVQAGLVRVWDRYGDYGYVGFFLAGAMRTTIVEGTANTHLEHFCFSCRTLGMGIEQWVYAHLGFPEIDLVGETITTLRLGDSIGWISEARQFSSTPQPVEMIAPRVIVTGGCEAHSVGAYLKAYTPNLQVVGNYVSGALFTRMNSATILLDMRDRMKRAFGEEAARLGLPAYSETLDLFGEENDGACYLMNCGFDVGYHHLYRHNETGWTLYLEPRADGGISILAPEAEILAHVKEHGHFYDEEKRAHLLLAARHMRENYRAVRPEMTPRARMQELIESIPKGAKLLLVAPHDESRPDFPKKNIRTDPEIRAFGDMLNDLTANYDYAGVVRLGEAITSIDDMLEADHFARQVYFRIAMLAVEKFKTLRPRTTYPRQRRLIMRDVLAAETIARRAAESRDVVQAAFETFLGRPPEHWHHADALMNEHITIGEFLRGMGASGEFHSKWQRK